jgi:hypothetical protein
MLSGYGCMSSLFYGPRRGECCGEGEDRSMSLLDCRLALLGDDEVRERGRKSSEREEGTVRLSCAG